MPELTISPEKIGFLIEKAREFDVKEAATDLDSGSNGADDNMIDVLEDDGSDPVARARRADQPQLVEQVADDRRGVLRAEVIEEDGA